jgi:hypothetical protein
MHRFASSRPTNGSWVRADLISFLSLAVACLEQLAKRAEKRADAEEGREKAKEEGECQHRWLNGAVHTFIIAN